MTEEDKKDFVVRDKRAASQDMPDGGTDAETPQTEAPSAEKRKSSSPLPINFSTFVLSLSSSAAMSLGGYQDPVSGHVPRNLEIAKQTIDILAILKEKTAGNLDKDEQSLLEASLYELRMRYVEEVKKG